MVVIAIIPWLLALLTVHRIVLIIYRLYFHPLSRFPGPKLAASTSLFAAYYNLVLGGRFTRKLPELHGKYGRSRKAITCLPKLMNEGPIIRSHPDELHIHDVDAYNAIFKTGTHFDKDKRFYGFPFEGSHFSMTSLKTAKPRRDMFQPHLSQRAIIGVQGLLETSVWEFINILRQQAMERNVVDLTLGYRCVTSDMALGYSFQKPLQALKHPGFKFPLTMKLSAMLKSGFVAQHFPRTFTLIFKSITCLPHCILQILGLAFFVDLHSVSFGTLIWRHLADKCQGMPENDPRACQEPPQGERKAQPNVVRHDG